MKHKWLALIMPVLLLPLWIIGGFWEWRAWTARATSQEIATIRCSGNRCWRWLLSNVTNDPPESIHLVNLRLRSQTLSKFNRTRIVRHEDVSFSRFEIFANFSVQERNNMRFPTYDFLAYINLLIWLLLLSLIEKKNTKILISFFALFSRSTVDRISFFKATERPLGSSARYTNPKPPT